MERIKGFTKPTTCYAIRADWLKKKPANVDREQLRQLGESEEQDAKEESKR
jgi:hypothetical protein